MNIAIRTAVLEDFERIRPLQKEIADLHHNGRPDIFDCFYIDDICVLKTYQRNGIGQKLFDCCKKKATEEKCKMLDLGVWTFNYDAIAFYKNCGMKDRVRLISSFFLLPCSPDWIK